MYEKYAELRDLKGVRDADVARATGIGRSTFSDWRTGRSAPKQEKLQKIADYFGVTVEYISTGKEPETYYLNEETAMIAQEVFDNANLRVLFDAARDARPEDIKMVAEMLKRLKETNPDG